jgi:hypothetical protein
MGFYQFQPLADPAAITVIGNYRITVLTSRCLRVEFNAARRFQDGATLTFAFRRQPVPPREIAQIPDGLSITTEHLHLRVTQPLRPPTPETLAISCRRDRFRWRHGDREQSNLSGTTRTLDCQSGACDLSPGLIARDGYSIVDDTNSPVIDAGGLFHPNDSQVDFYFFGYWHDYNACVSDFLRLSGRPPLLPRYAYGNWWSRYWAYRDDEMLAVADAFKAHDVDLSVFVVDMDWHVTETGNESRGWTGYTYNRKFIPDPARLFRALHDRGLRVTLNLHPADGVWPHEEQHAEFARRQRTPPGQPIPFDCTDALFMRNYFELLHHPHEALGVDFWWIDWQQGTGDLVDPLTVLNHQHFADIGREPNRKRALILSRWCGLGGQRYPIGFSGDTTVEWISLQFQPYFTATSANVGFGFWSHDIGGHFGGHECGELFVRWLQFGALSPILRLHSTNNRVHSRMPWLFDFDVETYGCAALRLHSQLIPLMYSLGYRNHAAGIQPVRPLYYLYPEIEDAYFCPAEYLLGDDIIVAPFITPIDPVTGLATNAVWLPPDLWFDFQTGRDYTGGWHFISGDLSRIPIFVRAGGFVPTEVNDVLTVHVFPGGARRFELFEDDGVTSGGGAHLTAFVSASANDRLSVVIEGTGDRAFATEHVVLRFRNVAAAATVELANAEEFGRTAEDEALDVDIAITDWPASITLTHPDLQRRRHVDIERIIRASSLNTLMKEHVFRELTRAVLAGAGAAEIAAVILELETVPEAEKRLLYGELCGLGYWRFTPSMGKDAFVVWNTRGAAAFQWVVSDENRKEQTRRFVGQVPSSKVWDMKEGRTTKHEYCSEIFERRIAVEVLLGGFTLFSTNFDRE